MPEAFKQAAEKLNAASSVLVVLPPLATIDAVAAGLGLSSVLKKTGKETTVVSADGALNPQANFLPGFGQVMLEIALAKSFIIDVSTKRAEVAELTYKKEADRISVHLKPKSGEFSPEDVTFRASKFPYDAVVVIGADKLESLGQFYARYAELFFETPVVNMDFRGSNTNFGQFNLVQLNSSSQSEVAFDLIGELGKGLVDADTATILLAGIIAETNSFQHGRTTPQSFLKASTLIGLGGRQQEIVTSLYRNKSMGFLKLWGRALARMKSEPAIQLASSAVTSDDIRKSGATEQEIPAILSEMSAQLSFAKIHLFFREMTDSSTEVYCSAPASLRLASALAQYQPASLRPQALRFAVPLPLAAAELQITEIVRREAAKLA